MKKRYITSAIEKAYDVKDQGKFQKNNSLRSAKFVFEVSNELYQNLNRVDLDLKVQQVSDGGHKTSGEWLFDAAVVKAQEINESGSRNSTQLINTEIEWALESEYATGLKALCDDFSKLLVVKAKHLVYLNGLNQQSDSGIENYIKTRLQTIEGFLNQIGFTDLDLYFGFWPSPEKIKSTGESQWDGKTLEELRNTIQLYHFNTGTMSFVPIEF